MSEKKVEPLHLMHPHSMTIVVLLNMAAACTNTGDAHKQNSCPKSAQHERKDNTIHPPSVTPRVGQLLIRWVLQEIRVLEFKDSHWYGMCESLHDLGDRLYAGLSMFFQDDDFREVESWMRRILVRACESPDALLDVLEDLASVSTMSREVIRMQQLTSSPNLESYTTFGLFNNTSRIVRLKRHFDALADLYEQVVQSVWHRPHRRDCTAAQYRFHLLIEERACNLLNCSLLDLPICECGWQKCSAFEELATNICRVLAVDPELKCAHLATLLHCLSHQEIQGSLDAVHRYFDYALSRGGPQVSRDQQTDVIQYAALSLTAVHFRFNHDDSASLALHETLQVAQQGRDHECVTYAMMWLHYLEDCLLTRYEVSSIRRTVEDCTHGRVDLCPHQTLFGGFFSMQRPRSLTSDELRRCVIRVFNCQSSTTTALGEDDHGDMHVATSLAAAGAQTCTSILQVSDRSQSFVHEAQLFTHQYMWREALSSSRSLQPEPKASLQLTYHPGRSSLKSMWPWLQASVVASTNSVEGNIDHAKPQVPSLRSGSVESEDDTKARLHLHARLPGLEMRMANFCRRLILDTSHTAVYRHLSAAVAWRRAGNRRLAWLETLSAMESSHYAELPRRMKAHTSFCTSGRSFLEIGGVNNYSCSNAAHRLSARPNLGEAGSRTSLRCYSGHDHDRIKNVNTVVGKISAIKVRSAGLARRVSRELCSLAGYSWAGSWRSGRYLPFRACSVLRESASAFFSQRKCTLHPALTGQCHHRRMLIVISA